MLCLICSDDFDCECPCEGKAAAASYTACCAVITGGAGLYVTAKYIGTSTTTLVAGGVTGALIPPAVVLCSWGIFACTNRNNSDVRRESNGASLNEPLRNPAERKDSLGLGPVPVAMQ